MMDMLLKQVQDRQMCAENVALDYNVSFDTKGSPVLDIGTRK